MQDLLLFTLESVKQYAIETDPVTTAEFRDHMSRVIKKLRAGGTDTQEATRTEIRGELRDYHDRAARYIDHLRSELTSTGKALNELLATCQSDGGAQQKLDEQVKRVRSFESAHSIDDVRRNARVIAQAIAQCAEQFKLEKESVVVQLRDEIRTLQKAVEDAQRAARVDDVTGCFNRQEMERSIKREIVAQRPVTIIHIWMKNFEALRDVYSIRIIDQLSVFFSKRVIALAKEALVGRWTNDVFCVLISRNAARDLGSEILRRCSGAYVCMHEGSERTVKVQLAVTYLDPQPDEDLDAFVQKIEFLNAKQRE